MSGAVASLRPAAETGARSPCLLGVFEPWRLETYGYLLAALYAALLFLLYRAGYWLADSTGSPVYTDFTLCWVVGWQALHGETAALYVPAASARVQEALVGHSVYTTWPYPPTFFLILAPLALLPYVAAFLTWDLLTLLGCIAVVCLIVQQRPAVALTLATPFTAWNFYAGQNGFLWASLLGASLLLLERRPVLAGVFMGCLTYKPQFGILLPVALVASRQWRAFASATATAVLLAGASVAAFGFDGWAAFPRELAAQSRLVLSVDLEKVPMFLWGRVQTVYGLVRILTSDPVIPWFAQGLVTASAAIIVALVWRTRVRYTLKAATLSAAALIATPYAFATDMAAIVIPVAFLVRDQIDCGLLRSEQTILIALFGVGFVILVTLGGAPLGPFVMIALLWVIVRRAFFHGGQPAIFT
jgi:arabinofuranan 3-O-arabinosyltransferase